MNPSVLTPEAKETLRKHVRALRERLLVTLGEAARGEYQLDVSTDKARLPEARRYRRERLDAWLDEQTRATRAAKGQREETRARFFKQAVEEAAHTLLNRLVFLRILEHHDVIAPHVVTGGFRSTGYAGEFLHYAGPLAQDEAKGYGQLLSAVFDELALELPGLFGPVGLTVLFPVPAAALREVVEVLDDPALASAWGDDTTLGWVYQYWNDPAREALDAKISGGGKIEPHEIASKTQMFTERYMVEWLLQNSLGPTWLCICKKNGWMPAADAILPELDARRAAWRAKRDAGEVARDALMPIAPGLETDWEYYVPQPIPEDAVAKAPASIADVKVLDPACGSGHFLVIAFGLLASMYEEEARHRGEPLTAAGVAERIVANNLHGIDIDARAIQIAAAALWLKARLYAPEARLGQMNLVAPSFRLAALPKDDPARIALLDELSRLGVPRETSGRLVESLAGVDHLGTLLRIDREIAALLATAEEEQGPLFAHAAKRKRAEFEEKVAAFLDAHAAESDLGLRLEGEQLAAGVRFIELVKEGRYDVVVGNPPYHGVSKLSDTRYYTAHYPEGRADLFAGFYLRGLELAKEGGICAYITLSNWMFLGTYAALRGELRKHRLRTLADLGKAAFTTGGTLISTTCAAFQRADPRGQSIAVRPHSPDEVVRDDGQPLRTQAALLIQRGRYEFDPNGFEVIEGAPVVYWWTKEFLERYGRTPKLGEVSPARQGLATGDNTRFVRLPWEVRGAPRTPDLAQVNAAWVSYIKGAAGQEWFEPLKDLVRWDLGGAELQHFVVNERPASRPQNTNFYFRLGIAFSMIGATFSARAHRFPSIFGHKGSSVFPGNAIRADALCLMNSTTARFILQSLNPGIGFEIGDVNRLPVFSIPNADEIVGRVADAFTEHESHREPSVEFRNPGPTPWRAAQIWAQLAVDRPEGDPPAAYAPELDPPDPEAHVSFAIGVALGRFGAAGEGILDAAPDAALPAGIFFVGPDEGYPDSLRHPSVAPVIAAWDAFTPAGRKPALRDWLRKDFFAYHKALYENRPIYFPLSSEKKTFVAWVSIHRWTDATLKTLLADHLRPVLRQLAAEIADVNAARASSDRRTAAAAERQYEKARRLHDELDAFIASVTACADDGAPPTDSNCPPREVNKTFAMDLDDGVMVNSAALWPLLAPQWTDPKKWWKQVCLAAGRKDFDWAHLAKRYFPTRVEEKCKKDPSLAVAHGCFWRYHPAKAFAWELRLHDEIREGFTIDEPGSGEARAAYLREFAADAEEARAKERIRRERKAARRDEEAEDSDEASTDEDASEGEDDE